MCIPKMDLIKFFVRKSFIELRQTDRAHCGWDSNINRNRTIPSVAANGAIWMDNGPFLWCIDN